LRRGLVHIVYSILLYSDMFNWENWSNRNEISHGSKWQQEILSLYSFEWTFECVKNDVLLQSNYIALPVSIDCPVIVIKMSSFA